MRSGHIKYANRPGTRSAQVTQPLLARPIVLRTRDDREVLRNVGYKPGRSINKGNPIVLFKPHLGGWQVRPIHTLPANRAACSSLRTDTAYG